MFERTTLALGALVVSLFAPATATAQATTVEAATEGATSVDTASEPVGGAASSTVEQEPTATTEPAAGPTATTSDDVNSTQRRRQPPRPPFHYHLVIDVGFSHWLGSTFDAPAGIYTPALTIHVVPLEWLEVALQYTGSVIEFTIPTATRTSQIGFVELSLVLRKELQVGGDLLLLGCGPMVGLVYDVLGVGIAFGAEIVGRYLVQLGNALAVGPFIDVRAVLYDLPGDPRPFYEVVDGKVLQGHLDAHIQLGAAVAF